MERYIGHAHVMSEEEANDLLKEELRDDMTISDVLSPYYEKVKNENDVIITPYISINSAATNENIGSTLNHELFHHYQNYIIFNIRFLFY